MIECWGISWGPLNRDTEYLPFSSVLGNAGSPFPGHLEHGHEFPPGQGIIAEKVEDLKLFTRRWPMGFVGIELTRTNGSKLIAIVKRQDEILSEPRLLIRELAE